MSSLFYNLQVGQAFEVEGSPFLKASPFTAIELVILEGELIEVRSIEWSFQPADRVKPLAFRITKTEPST